MLITSFWKSLFFNFMAGLALALLVIGLYLFLTDQFVFSNYRVNENNLIEEDYVLSVMRDDDFALKVINFKQRVALSKSREVD